MDLDRLHVSILPDNLTKAQALDNLIETVYASGVITDHRAFRNAVFEREAIMSTGIGSGVAIPHVRSFEVSEARLGVGISTGGINFDTLDKQPVHVVVLFAMPASHHKEYLGFLAQVMVTLKTPGVQEALRDCTSCEEVLAVLDTLHEQGSHTTTV